MAEKEYIEREAAISFPFANGQYDREHADEHFINGCESYREWLEQLPAADVVSKEQYDQLLRAARRMHEWIFINSCDELEAYRECGLTDEDNDLLGYIGQMQLEVRLEAKTREEAEAALKGGQGDV